MIRNGKDVSLSLGMGNLPNVAGALEGWFQSITIKLITKVVEDYAVTETETSLSFRGVVQPLSPQQIEMKPEGQRNWQWLQIHSAVELNLNLDDVVYYDSVRFRIKSKDQYNHYGYFRYDLAEDYENVG